MRLIAYSIIAGSIALSVTGCNDDLLDGLPTPTPSPTPIPSPTPSEDAEAQAADDAEDIVLQDDTFVPIVELAAMTINDVDGAEIYAQDGTFLGEVSQNVASPDSIANPVGVYGSTTSITSIFNPDGFYGSLISDTSPNNPSATRPPILEKSGFKPTYLTENETITPRLSTEEVKTWVGR